MLEPQAVDKMDTSDFQRHNKSDDRSEVMSDNKMAATGIVESHGQSALQNSIETGAVSLEPVRTEQDKTHVESVGGGNSASDGKNIQEEGKGKIDEDGEKGAAGSETSKRKAQLDVGVMHKKKKTGLSGEISLIKMSPIAGISLLMCTAFQDVLLYSPVEVYHLLGGICWPHLQG
jgi:hypothetical protein